MKYYIYEVHNDGKFYLSFSKGYGIHFQHEFNETVKLYKSKEEAEKSASYLAGKVFVDKVA